ncbi:MAG: leucine-rich repeat protein, partial [Clostridia bacterium]|nr:leucine-rich repeat protein [Clostridia bacterium]
AHLLDSESETQQIPTPEELFDKAGYVLTKCETDEDVKSFMHYYQPAERLCTFHDPDRINTNTIFWAVKKNVDEIRREDFKNPMRQDEYGTSVISLQFTKGETSLLSIKNRYNHTVLNPDNTFSNDLENIYPGLTKSFEEHYGIHQVENAGRFEIPNYVLANDGRRYRYNNEIDNVYYCPNNIIIRNGEVEYYDSRRYDIVDYFIIDKQEKTLIQAPNMKIQDSFADAHKDIEKIEIEKIKDTDGEKRITITMKGNAKAVVTINKYNRIISYINNSLTTCGDNFLNGNATIREIVMTSLISSGNNCFSKHPNLTSIKLPNLTTCGYSCFNNYTKLPSLSLPKLSSCGSDCFFAYIEVSSLDLPNLSSCGNACFYAFNKLTSIDLSKLATCGDYCFNYDIRNIPDINYWSSYVTTSLNLPNLSSCGDACFCKFKRLSTLNLPSLKSFGNRCFDFGSFYYRELSKIDFSSLSLDEIKQLPQEMQKLIKSNQEQSK